MPYKNKASRKQEHQRRKDNRLCIACSQPNKDSKFFKCLRCIKLERINRANRGHKRIRSGLCAKCGKRKLASTSKFLCQYHLNKENDRCRGNKHRHAQYRVWRQRLKLEVLQHYSGHGHPHCKCCGENNQLCLTLDHTNTDGAKHRRQVGSTYIYPWIKKHGFPKGFAVLCFTCNHARFLNGGICPAAKEHAKLKVFRSESNLQKVRESLRGMHANA